MRLHIQALSLTCGVMAGLGIFLATIWSAFMGGSEMLELMSVFMIGYSVTMVGAFVGFLWGVVFGTIGGFLFGSIYHLMMDFLGRGMDARRSEGIHPHDKRMAA